MTKTKYWLSIVAIAVVLIAGSIAINPVAIADDDDDDEVEASIEAELELEQDGADVDVEVEAEGLEPNEDFTLRAYSGTDCKGSLAGNPLKTETSDDEGNLEISGTIDDEVVGDVNSVSIRDDDGTSLGQIVVCFQNTTPS